MAKITVQQLDSILIPCVFNIVATCLMTLFDTSNVFVGKLSYISIMPCIGKLVAHTNQVLPTLVKYYLGESLSHIIPCLGTFQHNCILKAFLVRKLAFHHRLCSIILMTWSFSFPPFRMSSLSSVVKFSDFTKIA